MLEPATLETTSQMQTHESKQKRPGKCCFGGVFFDNLENNLGGILWKVIEREDWILWTQKMCHDLA